MGSGGGGWEVIGGRMSSGCFVTAFHVTLPLGQSFLSPPTAEQGGSPVPVG